MRSTTRSLIAAATLLGGTLIFGSTSGPAAADYAPFVVVDPVEGPAGTTITTANDPAGWCADHVEQPDGTQTRGEPGTVVVEMGTLAATPDIGGVVNLDEVLASKTITADADGNWSATFTIPTDAQPGDVFYVTGHCDAELILLPSTTTTAPTTTTTQPVPRAAPRALLFDYYPAKFTVVGDTTTTTSGVSGTGATPATPVSGTSDFTG